MALTALCCFFSETLVKVAQPRASFLCFTEADHTLSSPLRPLGPAALLPDLSPRCGKVAPQGFVFALIHHRTLGSPFPTSALASVPGNCSNGSFSLFLSNRGSCAHHPVSPLLVIKSSPRSSHPTRLFFNIIFISFPIFFPPNYHLAANPKEFLYYS